MREPRAAEGGGGQLASWIVGGVVLSVFLPILDVVGKLSGN